MLPAGRNRQQARDGRRREGLNEGQAIFEDPLSSFIDMFEQSATSLGIWIAEQAALGAAGVARAFAGGGPVLGGGPGGPHFNPALQQSLPGDVVALLNAVASVDVGDDVHDGNNKYSRCDVGLMPGNAAQGLPGLNVRDGVQPALDYNVQLVLSDRRPCTWASRRYLTTPGATRMTDPNNSEESNFVFNLGNLQTTGANTLVLDVFRIKERAAGLSVSRRVRITHVGLGPGFLPGLDKVFMHLIAGQMTDRNEPNNARPAPICASLEQLASVRAYQGGETVPHGYYFTMGTEAAPNPPLGVNTTVASYPNGRLKEVDSNFGNAAFLYSRIDTLLLQLAYQAGHPQELVPAPVAVMYVYNFPRGIWQGFLYEVKVNRDSRMPEIKTTLKAQAGPKLAATFVLSCKVLDITRMRGDWSGQVYDEEALADARADAGQGPPRAGPMSPGRRVISPGPIRNLAPDDGHRRKRNREGDGGGAGPMRRPPLAQNREDVRCLQWAHRLNDRDAPYADAPLTIRMTKGYDDNNLFPKIAVGETAKYDQTRPCGCFRHPDALRGGLWQPGRAAAQATPNHQRTAMGEPPAGAVPPAAGLPKLWGGGIGRDNFYPDRMLFLNPMLANRLVELLDQDDAGKWDEASIRQVSGKNAAGAVFYQSAFGD